MMTKMAMPQNVLGLFTDFGGHRLINALYFSFMCLMFTLLKHECKVHICEKVSEKLTCMGRNFQSELCQHFEGIF